ncbi:DHA2 family efflux MFS transporter permease subunit [Agromyces aerolatus]|uniref:DHA2 family efflux MFS transporter permease subunit n=1 Tax=Agromyces sp. LY-1074 TaxID=3074080 RepID=UPI00285B454E|nr:MULTISPECIES: DHA2 family efflux MFS transporter permease subunit [unclassified Agromyces]MDR5698745.1 DHA2 family efflux MFS transporter permease subunit [Agromyces sp. LY-1074]MDR5705039.1 DHA2 family efflux MFS transporter permease subunit [Agromyces sp. LY-1358]
MQTERRPWPALWALVIGFFMILVDSTIVSIANPAILADLDTTLTAVIWVTSAYLLAYAVPLLITGRLGDRFGPKNVYLVGLTVFTLASLWCGLSGTVEWLIAARAVQGLGAALMTPQTMAVITRIFPPTQRGTAMGLWGAVAGVATLVGPILGGVLVDSLGWEWIFFVNVPVGIVAFVLAWRLVPHLETHSHRFDWLGVVLSAAGMFLLVFGIQEGETFDWGVVAGPITVWGLIVAGLVVLAGFVVWQHFNRAEPLLPLTLFRDRNFALSNAGIGLVGLAITAMPLPLAFYFQVARGLEPTQAALMLVPMAVLAGVMAPVVGRLNDRMNPKWLAVAGFLIVAASLALYAVLLTPDQPLWVLLIPSALLGLGQSGIWSPLASTATRNLPPAQAGAGSGVYNMTRQVGAVLGSAAIAALLDARLAAELPGFDSATAQQAGAGGSGGLPPAVAEGFSAAMSQSLWLPVAAFLAGAVVVLWFARPKVTVDWSERGAEDADAAKVADPAP